jgi:hypothetical protein
MTTPIKYGRSAQWALTFLAFTMACSLQASEPNVLEEVVVTSQRYSSSVQTAPFAVTAITSQALGVPQ